MGERIKVIDRKEIEGVIFEILEYENLQGSSDPAIAQQLYYSQKIGIKLRQIKVTLKNPNSEVITEAGALNYFKGRIRAENKVGGLTGFAKKLFNNQVNDEELFRPSYIGVGEVFLEPSFKHFAIIHLDNDEVIVDKGMFYCCSKNLDVGIVSMKNFSSAIFGSDGLFQTTIRGTGLLVVEVPVPMGELREVRLNNEILQVDGNFAVMRTGGVKYQVKLANRGILRTLASSEGLVEHFEGNGIVWLAPTSDVYDSLSDSLYNGTIREYSNNTNKSKKRNFFNN